MISKIFEKRRYQERAVEEFDKWILSSERIASIILPTGCGKSFVAASCIKNYTGHKILWASHRAELIDQGYNTLQSIIQNRQIDIEMADKKANPDSDIVVGSVQTISHNRKHFKEFVPDLIFIDEWHHFSENNIQYDSLLKRWPHAKILTATATPFRFNGESLPLGRVLIQMDIGTAVEKNYLVPPVAEALLTNVSLADVKTRMGDFAINELSKTINTEERNKLIINRIIELARNGRQGICFAADVTHSKSLYELAKKEIRAIEVYGDTPSEIRQNLMRKVRNGEVDCIFNNMIFTEGTDIPHLSFVAMTRPTRSLGLYQQAVGRGLRLNPETNKKDCIVIDVHDKVKMKQSRITFVDMAVAGDLYGEKKRATNVLKAEIPVEPISNNLKNFPIMINKNHSDRWTIDDEAFSISSWEISQDQWIVTWTYETKEPRMISKSVYVPWTELPPVNVNISGRAVQHNTFGAGKVIKIVDRDNPKILVEFAWGNQKIMEMSSLNVQKFIKEYSPSEVDIFKIDKLFYICMPNVDEAGRVIHFIKNGKNLVLKEDKRLDKFQADVYLQGEALKDGVLNLVRTSAKWKYAPASDKQKIYVEGMLDKIGFDIDLDTLTKGDASAIIDQAKWQNIIHAKFGTDYKQKLLGYDTMIQDV